MTENSWLELGTFRADNIHSWQTFETAQYWIRYLKIVIKNSYANTDTYFLTISNIKYFLELFYRVLGSTVAQGMQQILHNSNKTKTETFKQNLKAKSVTGLEKGAYKGAVGTASFLELEEEVKKLIISTDAKETIAEDLLKNASESWPAPQEMSVYESLIERVTTNEKSLVMIIEAFRDSSKLAESLEMELSKLIQYVLAHEKKKYKSLSNLKSELERKREEIRELREMQSTLEYISNKQDYMLSIIIGLLVILVTICISTCYYYKTLINKPNKKSAILLCRQSYGRSASENYVNKLMS